MLRAITLIAVFAVFVRAQSAPTSWNTWDTGSKGSIPTTQGPVEVTFSGNSTNFSVGYPSFKPADTWKDGLIVDRAPLPSNGVLGLAGGNGNVQTISFSSPVVDPVMAIWSLGSPSVAARFVFQGVTPDLVSGGPNAEYGGATLNVAGPTVLGFEGNGTIQIKGTFTSLSWTNPDYENWYGINVGLPGVAPVWTDLGFALAGTNGFPALAGTGLLTAGSANLLDLTNAKPNSKTIIAWSLVATYKPWLGGTMVPDLYGATFVDAATSGLGDLHLFFVWPPAPPGISLYIQMWTVDPGAIKGWSASNALKGSTG